MLPSSFSTVQLTRAPTTTSPPKTTALQTSSVHSASNTALKYWPVTPHSQTSMPLSLPSSTFALNPLLPLKSKTLSICWMDLSAIWSWSITPTPQTFWLPCLHGPSPTPVNKPARPKKITRLNVMRICMQLMQQQACFTTMQARPSVWTSQTAQEMTSTKTAGTCFTATKCLCLSLPTHKRPCFPLLPGTRKKTLSGAEKLMERIRSTIGPWTTSAGTTPRKTS